jgi:signal transduction histidine kinase
LGTWGWLLHLPLLLAALFITLYPLLRNAVHYQREKRQRTELTQLIVHDLKSPLTIVISGLDLLNRGSLGEITATQHRLLGNLEHCSHEVLRLVDDMLDVERMEEGVMPLHRSDIDLMPLLRELIAELQILADRHRQRLEFSAPESLPLAFVDQDLITRVVHNLVSNALKFTPDDGKIAVQISAERASIVLTIADSGPGVPPKERQRIFDKFAQLDTKNRRGKGLGLTFCRMAIEAHQGTLTVENSPLGGALFKISLPCEATPQGINNPETKPRPYRLMWGK